MRSVSDMKAVCAFTVGEQHIFLGTECQDYAMTAREDDVLCALLADGAGSVEHSEIAARAAVEALCADFMKQPEVWLSMEDSLLKQHIISLSTEAADNAQPGMKPDCTLLMYGQSGQRSILIHTGDGAAIGCGDRAVLLSSPENGAEAHLTYFLSGPDTPSHIRIMHDPDESLDTIILTSDGAERMLYDQINGVPANAPMIMAEWIRTSDEETVTEKLQETMETLFRRHSSDDLSIAIIYRSTDQS